MLSMTREFICEESSDLLKRSLSRVHEVDDSERGSEGKDLS